MIVARDYPPSGSGGLGCSGNCGCTSCQRGMGDTSGGFDFSTLTNALQGSWTIGSISLPVWMLAIFGVIVLSQAGKR